MTFSSFPPQIWDLETDSRSFTASSKASGIQGEGSACLYLPHPTALRVATDTIAPLHLRLRYEVTLLAPSRQLSRGHGEPSAAACNLLYHDPQLRPLGDLLSSMPHVFILHYVFGELPLTAPINHSSTTSLCYPQVWNLPLEPLSTHCSMSIGNCPGSPGGPHLRPHPYSRVAIQSQVMRRVLVEGPLAGFSCPALLNALKTCLPDSSTNEAASVASAPLCQATCHFLLGQESGCRLPFPRSGRSLTQSSP